MKNLPIGIETFPILRNPEDDYIYVDKTMYIHRMLVEKRYRNVFLSRPRRFGKSLLVSTLQALFEGRRELFHGLYIEDKWDFEEYPVIKISFAETDYSLEGALELSLQGNLEAAAEELHLTMPPITQYWYCFKQLIAAAAKATGKRVVVLIDEYDKPLLDVLTNPTQLEYHRKLLRSLYSVLKGMGSSLRFVFLTGVSKFSQVSIFSGLNNILDLSLDPDYAAICGYTQAELERDFAEHLKGVDLEQVRHWYDGYSFKARTPQDHVYAPYDVLLYLNDKEGDFQSHWFANSTPTFLVELLKQRTEPLPIQALESVQVPKCALSVDMINIMPLEALLYQTGYLTMKPAREIDDADVIRVGIPNQSVRAALAMQLISGLCTMKEAFNIRREAKQALLTGDMKVVSDHWNRLFASTSYDASRVKDYEAYYRDIAYTYCLMLRFDTHAEEHTSAGRIDLRVSVQDRLYLFEFKMKGGADPIAQIKSKGYADKFRGQFAHITLVGVICNPHPDSTKGEGIVDIKYEPLCEGENSTIERG